jgi:GntR family transcriptional regulator/MocR family aminotransferase
MEQAVLAEFMISGNFERHIRRMRRVYRNRRDAFSSALQSVLGSRAEAGPCHGGLTALVEIDSDRTAEAIAAKALEAGLALRPATRYFARPPRRPTFLIGFGGLPEAEARDAVTVLRDAAQ